VFDVDDKSSYMLVQIFDMLNDSSKVLIGEVWICLDILHKQEEVKRWWKLTNTLSGEVLLSLKLYDDQKQKKKNSQPETDDTIEPINNDNGYDDERNNNDNGYDEERYNNDDNGYDEERNNNDNNGYDEERYNNDDNGYEVNDDEGYNNEQVNNERQNGKRNIDKRNEQNNNEKRNGQERKDEPNINGHENNYGLIHFKPEDILRDYPHIAKGSFGIVFKGKVSQFGDKVIVIKDISVQNSRSFDDWKKEIEVMNLNRSPYIVEVYGYSIQRNALTIIMELMENGSLYDLIHIKHYKLSLLQRMRMARHCALGILILHSNNVIHRDVKSMNILVTEDFSCKITDFGCAKLISSNQQFMHMTLNSGTPLWMAPEVKLGMYSYSADIYSLGLVLYEIFELRLPDFNPYQQTIVLPKYFQSAPVVYPCLDRNPNNRPSCPEVVAALDKTINNILQTVRRLLPQEDIELLSQLSSGSSKDSLESDIQKLYRLLLNKNPNEVDSLINRALSNQNNDNDQRNNQNNTRNRPMQYQNNGYGYRQVKKKNKTHSHIPLSQI